MLNFAIMKRGLDLLPYSAGTFRYDHAAAPDGPGRDDDPVAQKKPTKFRLFQRKPRHRSVTTKCVTGRLAQLLLKKLDKKKEWL